MERGSSTKRPSRPASEILAKPFFVPMNPVLLALSACFALATASQPDARAFCSTQETDELFKYANVASVAYCISKGLETGIVGFQGPKCPSVACQHDEVSQMTIVDIFEFVGLLEVGSGYVALDHAAKLINVAFRGTASRVDWINNLDAFQVTYKPVVTMLEEYGMADSSFCQGCKIHKGMSSFLKTNAELVLKTILDLKASFPDFNLVVTGHSLGGALATLTGLELRLLGFDVLVVTLASPKIGDQRFADFVDGLFKTDEVASKIHEQHSFASLTTGLIRMVHINDIIPYLPPTKLFRHSGFEYFLSAEGTVQTSETIQRRGKDYVENEPKRLFEAIPNFRRLEHSSYFFAVSHCI